jgi:hypothetical protein
MLPGNKLALHSFIQYLQENWENLQNLQENEE